MSVNGSSNDHDYELEKEETGDYKFRFKVGETQHEFKVQMQDGEPFALMYGTQVFFTRVE